MPHITRKRLEEIKARERQIGFRRGHLVGSVKTYNKSQGVIRNAAKGGAAPDGQMARRMHNTVVDATMTFGEGVAQMVVDQAARRVAAGKKVRAKFAGKVIRPTRNVGVP